MFVIAGITMSFTTYAVLDDFEGGEITPRLILTILADFLLILAFSAFLFQEFARREAKAQDAGIASPLQVRLSGVFALGALVPTVIVASAGTLTFGIGLGDWLANEVRTELNEAAEAVDSYYSAELEKMNRDLAALAQSLNSEYLSNPELDSGTLRKTLQEKQNELKGDFEHVFVIKSDCSIAARGLDSYKFHYEQPPVGVMEILAPEAEFDGTECSGRTLSGHSVFADAEDTSIVIFRSENNLVFIGAAKIMNAHDRFIAASKPGNTAMLNLYDSIAVREGASGDTVRKLGNRIFQYSVGALAGALLLIFAMVRFGTWYSARISKPVTELAAAAEKVGQGQLDQKLTIPGNDEIARLGTIFNKMIKQLSTQRTRLSEQNEQVKKQNEQLSAQRTQLREQNEQVTKQNEQAQLRERTFRSVLSSVTPGVIGLDDDTTIMFMNRSASLILAVKEDRFNADSKRYEKAKLSDVFPETGDLIGKFENSDSDVLQDRIVIERYGSKQQLLVRCATRRNISGTVEGFVVAVDDVTDQVNAERKAAWSEVAQRIAHEVKNPLTPISVSTFHIRDSLAPNLDEADRDYLEEKVGVINSNIDRLARLTDEFRRFASMSDPIFRRVDIAALIEQAVIMEKVYAPRTKFQTKFSQKPIFVEIDRHYVLQVVENLLKNAREAIAEKSEALGQNAFTGQVRVEVSCSSSGVVADFMDNGVGFPEKRDKLLQPFFSTKNKGGREWQHKRGLGLSNVLRVIDGHRGRLELLDAPVFDGCDHQGALVRIVLPEKRIGADNVEK